MGPSTAHGDGDSFARLFDERREELFRFLCRLSGNLHDAEDLLQETFARLWSKRGQFRGEGSQAGYLRRIAFRTYLNARTRIRRVRATLPLQTEPPDGRASPVDAASDRDARRFLLERVRAAVEELPDGWREPFVLFRYEHMSCAEVADAMGLSPKAVEMRLRKAVRSLAKQLERLRAEYDGAPRGRAE